MRHPLALAAVVVLLFAPVSSADTLNAFGSDRIFHTFQTPVADNTVANRAFWNNASIDDSFNHNGNGPCNIGFWLSGTGGCAKANFYQGSPKATPDYLGNQNTTWDLTKSPDTTSVTVTTRQQVTSYQDTDQFGWFDVASPSVLNPLFNGVGVLNNSATFVPSGNYGFYLHSGEGKDYLSTGEGDSTHTHFAVFKLGEGHYIVGAEDMWTGSDWDYNDAIFEVQINTTTPEPASMMLLGTGLVGLGAAARRRRQNLK